MGNDRILTLVNEKKFLDAIEINLLCAFEYENNKYVIYTKGEKDYDENVIIYSGRIEMKENKQNIKNIDKEEYNKIKDIIKKMINYSGEEYDV